MRSRQPHPANPRFEDLSGRRFGTVTALFYIGKLRNQACWAARCDCGTQKEYTSTNLKRTKSCGCVHRANLSARNTTHGHTRLGVVPREHRLWQAMIRRCTDENAPAFKWYGARGVRVCDRWLFGESGITGYECFVVDMGKRPSSKHSLDRHPDNTGNYEPSNVRWATQKEQQRNRTNNHLVDFRGETITLTEAAERAGLNVNTVFGRLKLGWSIDRALNTPVFR